MSEMGELTFHLFAGDFYYPQGTDDYIGSFATLGAAIERESHGSEGSHFSWGEIMQTQQDGSLVLVKRRGWEGAGWESPKGAAK